MKHIKYGALLLAMILGVCQTNETSYAESIIMWKSQTVYVPIYSHIYREGNKRSSMNLSANLVIRNTDAAHEITIKSVNYYDSAGALLRNYLEKPMVLNPMASTYFLVETSDTSGGMGANFIVEWETQKTVTEPIIEALFSGSIGTRAYSFISRGKATRGVYE